MSQLKIKNGNTWESIPAGGIGVPSGGTTGQVLQKSSNTDYATEWASKGMTLLWTNPNPTSAFAAQTLSVDTSDYSFIAVEFRTHINVDNYLVSIMRTGTKSGFGVMVMGGFFNPSTQANANGYTREVDLTSSSSIGISGSFYASAATSWKSTASTNEMIPTNIWGIKF